MKMQLQSLSLAACLVTAAALLSTGCAGDRYRQSTGEHIDDSATSTRVKSALADDTQYKYSMVQVKTFKGTTQLSGFVNTRDQCDQVVTLLGKAGHACAIYRGEMDKVERRANLKAFRDGATHLLISTDLGSRGLDLESVGRVINYHLPQQVENYLHRVGRTARAGRPGLVINFVTERDRALIDQLARMSAR